MKECSFKPLTLAFKSNLDLMEKGKSKKKFLDDD